MTQTMKIRELIALSHISFQDDANAQNRYAKGKQLMHFLNHRESMVNATLKKQCFIREEISLFTYFLQPLYFVSNPLPLSKLETDFAKQFDSLFYKFQAKKMENGDNPYLFNTILIKNEGKVKLLETECEGGFSRINYAEMQITYT